MAGLIKDEDIQLVRERVRIDEVVEQYVTLRNAGGGARKGLCPFHDEKTPSFNVSASRGTYHCFGCGEGGDAIKFLQQIEGLTFVESVERLASKYGVQLRYDERVQRGPRRDPQQRQRLLEAHKVAGEFYAQMLQSAPEAQVGRQFVQDRGFDQSAAETFGMGFAPRGGEALVAHLRGKGFTEDELTVGGLASRGQRGLYDRFRGRLLWPIREMTGEVIGFGARRMFDDDRVEAKYLNTSETPIYKKSQVLYGIDLARRQISGSSQAVVVEGYTDVMACHQAGVRTAVATCGTAFGEDHARVLRRILLDHDALHGEVIFTFDGDEAGQRAAMKAFEGDEQFVTQTYVAVEPRGMDPCDLRLADGDAAVRELVASRVPLYRFVLDNVLERYDLDRSDQRIDAVREAVGLTRAIRDRSKTEEFLREVAQKVGVEIDQVRAELRRVKAQPDKHKPRTPSAASSEPAAQAPAQPFVSFGAPEFADEREGLKILTQIPHLVADLVDDIHDNDFSHPAARAIVSTMQDIGFAQHPDATWVPRLSDALPSDDLRRIVSVAANEPLASTDRSAEAAARSLLLTLQYRTVSRRIDEVKSKLQRTNPIEQLEEYNRQFGELIALEQQARQVRDRALGN